MTHSYDNTSRQRSKLIDELRLKGVEEIEDDVWSNMLPGSRVATEINRCFLSFIYNELNKL
jgi:hypothetical protein